MGFNHKIKGYGQTSEAASVKAQIQARHVGGQQFVQQAKIAPAPANGPRKG
jgi:hypothetical protein